MKIISGNEVQVDYFHFALSAFTPNFLLEVSLRG